MTFSKLMSFAVALFVSFQALAHDGTALQMIESQKISERFAAGFLRIFKKRSDYKKKEAVFEYAKEFNKIGIRYVMEKDEQSALVSLKIAENLYTFLSSAAPTISWVRDLYAALLGEDLHTEEILNPFNRSVSVLRAAAGLGDGYEIAIALIERVIEAKTIASDKRMGSVEQERVQAERGLIANKDRPDFTKNENIYRYGIAFRDLGRQHFIAGNYEFSRISFIFSRELFHFLASATPVVSWVCHLYGTLLGESLHEEKFDVLSRALAILGAAIGFGVKAENAIEVMAQVMADVGREYPTETFVAVANILGDGEVFYCTRFCDKAPLKNCNLKEAGNDSKNMVEVTLKLFADFSRSENDLQGMQNSEWISFAQQGSSFFQNTLSIKVRPLDEVIVKWQEGKLKLEQDILNYRSASQSFDDYKALIQISAEIEQLFKLSEKESYTNSKYKEQIKTILKCSDEQSLEDCNLLEKLLLQSSAVLSLEGSRTVSRLNTVLLSALENSASCNDFSLDRLLSEEQIEVLNTMVRKNEKLAETEKQSLHFKNLEKEAQKKLSILWCQSKNHLDWNGENHGTCE